MLNHNFLISLLDTSSTLALAKTIAMSAVLDVALGGFAECTGLEMSLDVEEYREGGRNGDSAQVPDPHQWTHITLKKGVGRRNALWDWALRVHGGQGQAP